MSAGDFRGEGEMVRHPQREMLAGTAGSEVPGAGPYGNTAHSPFTDKCVRCRYDQTTPGVTPSHEFEPQLATCQGCHPALATFNRAAGGDYDGDGGVEGIQDEVTGLLDAVKGALLTDPNVTFAGNYFDYAGAADHKLTGAPDAQKRAAFNWYSVSFDASRGVHNALRAVRLFQTSYREVTGADVPGATLL